MISLFKRARSAARRTVATVCTATFVSILGALALGPAVIAAPEPSPIPKRWQLEIAPSALMTAVVGDKSYFFMTYRVTNNSSQDLLFAPSFELSTDDGTLIRSGRDVPLEATREIISRLADPMLEDQISIVGTLLRGPENAKVGVVIWPIPQQHLSEVSVFCAGFSGETATVEVPSATKPGQNEKKLLRKSHWLRFRMPGQIKPGTGESFTPDEARWIMR